MDDRIINNEELIKILNLFNDGCGVLDISKKTGVSPYDVMIILFTNGCKPKRIPRDDVIDIGILSELYKNSKWDEIFKIYPFFNKSTIYSIMSKYCVSKDNYFWSKEDVNILTEYYNKLNNNDISKLMNNRHSPNAISDKAKKMNLTQPQEWTKEEIDIIIKNYSHVETSEMLKLLPNRTYNAIICMAIKLKIKSYHRIKERYTDKEKKFIKDNFGVLTDAEIAKIINKTPNGIRDQRAKMKLCYACKDYSKYESLSKFFRGHIQEWKNSSMKACNYQCVFTGSKDYVIHHIYGFNLILSEVYEILLNTGKLKSTALTDYSKEELDDMLIVFNDIHKKYPLGICVRSDIHDLFHSIYGAGGNILEQWERFTQDYNNHKFDSVYYI